MGETCGVMGISKMKLSVRGVVLKGGKAKGNEFRVSRGRASYWEERAVKSERMDKRLSHGDHRACDKNNIIQQKMR